MIRLNKKSIILFGIMTFVVIMSFGVISATNIIATISTIEPVIQGHSVELPQGGTNGTAPWSSCSISTIVDPNHNTLVSGVSMTMVVPGSFIYILSGSNTTILGKYTVTGTCTDGINIVPFAYTFPVTTTGRSDSLSFWISLILIILSLIIIVIAFMWDNLYVAFIAGTLFIMTGILITTKGFGSILDIYSNAVGIIILGLGLIIFLATSFHYGEDLSSAFGLEKKEKDPHDYFNDEDE